MLRQLTQALVLLTFSAASVCLIRPADAHDTRADHHHDHKSSSNKSSKKTQKSEKPDPWHLLEMALTPAAYAATPRVTISTNSGYRFIRADGMPDHATGSFPNAGNPNRISEQTYDFRMPSQPAYATHTTPLGMARFGVAINGIPFDPGANEFFNGDPSTGWQYEAMYLGAKLGLDRNNAHVQPNGAYHYHGVPTALLQRLGKANRPVLLGYAADGFPIYGPFGYQDAKNPRSKMTKLQSSYRLRSGNRQSGPGGRYDGAFTQDYEYVKGAGDLDDCNGRVAVTPEFPKGTYHYVITESFPYIPRGFKGTPDNTFAKGPGGFGAMPGGGPGGRFGGGPGGQGGFGRRRMQGPHDSFRPDGLGSPGSFSGGGGFGGPPGGGGFGGPPGGGPPDGGGFGGPPGRGFNGAHGGRQGYGSSQGSHYDPDRFGTGHSGSGSTSGGRFPGGGMSGREGGFGGQPGGGGFGGPPGGGGFGGPPGGGFGGPPGGGFGGPPGGGFGGPPGGGFGGPPGGGFGGPPGGHGPPPGGELGSADFKPPGGATPPGGGALNNQSQHKQPNEESQQNLQQVPSKDEPAQESPADSPNSKGSTK